LPSLACPVLSRLPLPCSAMPRNGDARIERMLAAFLPIANAETRRNAERLRCGVRQPANEPPVPAADGWRKRGFGMRFSLSVAVAVA
jgi:hypothetical protein